MNQYAQILQDKKTLELQQVRVLGIRDSSKSARFFRQFLQINQTEDWISWEWFQWDESQGEFCCFNLDQFDAVFLVVSLSFHSQFLEMWQTWVKPEKMPVFGLIEEEEEETVTEWKVSLLNGESNHLLQQLIQTRLKTYQLEGILEQQRQDLESAELKSQKLEVLYELSHQLGYSLNYEELIHQMLAHLDRAIPHDVSASILMTEESCHLFIQPICPLTLGVQYEIQQRLVKTFGRMRGDSAHFQKQPYHLTKLESEQFDETRSPMLSLGSSFQVPIITADTQEVIGLIFVGCQAPDAFNEEEVRLLYTLAYQASVSIQRIQSLLAEEKQHLEGLVENLPEGVLLLNENYQIIVANPIAWKYLALLLDEVYDDRVTHLGTYSIQSLLESPPSGEFCHEIVLENHIFEVVAKSLVAKNHASSSHWLLSIRDVTARRQAEETLRIHDRAIAASNNGIIIADAKDPKLPIIYVNPAFEQITGYTASEVIGYNCRFLQGDEREQPGLNELRQALQEGRSCTVVLRNYRKNGTCFWNELSVSPICDRNGNLTHYIGIQTDITERKLAEEKLQHSANYDPLTDLPNRVLFSERLQQAITKSKQQSNYLFAVLFLDLDRFKNVNDSLGHLVGDQMLVAIAQRIQKSLRLEDTVARLGGDEFAILLEDIANVEKAVSIANLIHQALTSPLQINRHEVFTTVSIGIALSSNDYDSPEDLLRDADIAMYRAKASGKACNQVFDKTMHSGAVALLQLETDIRQAITRKEFELYYQPIVSLSNGQITGFESLIRWQHPTQGLVSPASFIPLAEETGLIVPMSWWILEEACHQLRLFQEEFPYSPPLTVSVNLPGQQFSEANLVTFIAQILEETGVNPKSLRIEITESAIMENVDLALDSLRRLKELGIQLYMDDFGTGYSSLSYLRRFPIDTIKIDRSFVMQMTDNEESLEIVRTIIMLARNLGMSAIAEGVETQAQLYQLKGLDCDYGQGYFFSKPVNAETVRTLLSQESRGNAPVLAPSNAPVLAPRE